MLGMSFFYEVSVGSVLAQATSDGTNMMIGWFLVALLAAIFVGFIVSILRTKPIDLSAVAENAEPAVRPTERPAPTMASTIETKTTSEASAPTIEEQEEKNARSAALAAAKPKGLKGKKKQQKKKLNSQNGRSFSSVSSSKATTDEGAVAQPLVGRLDSGVDSQGDGEPADTSDNDVSPLAIEPVSIASTHAINAMANKPRSVAKPKAREEKSTDAKNAVQGFHKMERYREPIRVVTSVVTTPTPSRTALQAAAVGGDAENDRPREPRRDRKPKRDRAEVSQVEPDGPRTLKDFITKKSDDE
jgi:hypothetical protein